VTINILIFVIIALSLIVKRIAWKPTCLIFFRKNRPRKGRLSIPVVRTLNGFGPEITRKDKQTEEKTQRRQKQRWCGTVCGLLSGGKHTGLWS
jgi:hypothetical protein